MQVFNARMPQPNQLFVRREDVVVTGKDLLSMRGVQGEHIVLLSRCVVWCMLCSHILGDQQLPS